MLIFDHQAAWEKFRILGTESNKFFLEIKENLLIRRDKQVLIGSNSFRNRCYLILSFWLVWSDAMFATIFYFPKKPLWISIRVRIIVFHFFLSHCKVESGGSILWKLVLMKKASEIGGSINLAANYLSIFIAFIIITVE